MPMNLQGGCRCGAVTFGLESHTPHPYQRCYCRICRKTAGGGGYAINIMGLAGTLAVTGEDAISVYRAGIEQDGAVQWNNFVVLTVAVGEDSWVFTVAGNIVVEEGPEAGLPDRLRSLVAALRDP